MKPNPFSERGQALIVIALAAIGLFGIVALAIDGSAKFSDRRHAQNAADTAALAAALAKVTALTNGVSDNSPTTNGPTTCPPPSGVLPSPVCEALQLEGLDRADSNGYDNNLVSNTVEVYSPPINGYYSGNNNYVQVIVTSNVNTYFARVIGINQTKNVVQAVALTKKGGPLFDGASIVSLNPDTASGCSGTMRVGGSSTISLNGGGMFVNSDEPDCAMEQQGGCPGISDLLVINGGGIVSAGNGNVDFDACTTNVPPITYDQMQIVVPDEVFMPDVPVECDSSVHPGSYHHTGGHSTELYPGYYASFPPHQARPNITLRPGVYCVDNNIQWTNGTFDSLTGNGVTIFITKGNDFSISGGHITLSAQNSGDYAGYLFIVDTDFTGSLGACTINGNSTNSFSGTIYAPYCDVSLSGSGSSGTPVNYSTQVIGYNVQLTGDSQVNFSYNPANNVVNKRKVGLMK